MTGELVHERMADDRTVEVGRVGTIDGRLIKVGRSAHFVIWRTPLMRLAYVLNVDQADQLQKSLLEAVNN